MTPNRGKTLVLRRSMERFVTAKHFIAAESGKRHLQAGPARARGNKIRVDTVHGRQVERAYTTLFPNKNLQERELNVYYFLSRYGPSLIEELHNAADLGFSNHKLLYIGGVASQVVNAR